jgi:L-alanine-DL-glutamate epimerase-like enolase superfamily enzyme
MTTDETPLRLHLQAPRRVAAGTLQVRGTARVREAVRIRLADGQGHVGLGEALPLPGYSPDDAATAERVLAAITAHCAADGLLVPLIFTDAPAAADDDDAEPAAGATEPLVEHGPAARLKATLQPWDRLLADAPSARFALECALTDLLARRGGLSAAHWLADGRALQAVPVSLLLSDDDRDVVSAASAAVAEGFGILKLKIARADRSEGAEDMLLDALRTAMDAACPPDCPPARLRLDANGVYGVGHAPRRVAALARFGIELVEEPAASRALLALPPLALPWAADESLAEPALARALLALPPGRRPSALVLKPAQLGLARCLQLAQSAAALGIGVIVTHSLDGDLGHAAACALAAALPVAPWPCGLAPHAGLRDPAPAQPWLRAPVAPGLGVADLGDER